MMALIPRLLQPMLFVTSIFLFLVGCSTKDFQFQNFSHLTKPDDVPSDTLITLDRSEIWNLGPQYRLWITGQGMVLYEGCAFGQTMEYRQKEIGLQRVLELIKAFRESSILELPDEYYPRDCESYFTDAPIVTFSIKLGLVRKKVGHYTGCTGFKFEQVFFHLENLIDSIGCSKEWVDRGKR